MNRYAIHGMGALLALVSCLHATAATDFSGTRSNISLGGVPDGRCGPAITVLFAPDALAASGQTNLGSFSYTASHCVAAPPPGPYYDGQFEWDFGDAKLFGTYDGLLTAGAAPAQFDVQETISFTGGTGRFLDATGSAVASGMLSFGMVEGVSVSFSDVGFEGSLNLPAIPEPGTWGLMLAGLAGLGAARRKMVQTGEGRSPHR
jgi:hypothetical protein